MGCMSSKPSRHGYYKLQDNHASEPLLYGEMVGKFSVPHAFKHGKHMHSHSSSGSVHNDYTEKEYAYPVRPAGPLAQTRFAEASRQLPVGVRRG